MAEREETVCFLNDVHIPFGDPQAIGCAIAVARAASPDRVFLVGDIVDFDQFGRFGTDPQRVLRVQSDLDKLAAFVDSVRAACPNAVVHYLAGNHEDRLTKWIWRNPEVSGIRALEPENLFGLSERGISYLPYLTPYIYRGFVVHHGATVRKWAGNSARGEFEKFGRSGISGHTHRLGRFRVRLHTGEHCWTENGCLCRRDPGWGLLPDWHHGLTIGTFRPTGRYQLEIVEIIHGEALFRGRTYLCPEAEGQTQ